jgi:glycosyltransferase involved in cell wall biosynthesis
LQQTSYTKSADATQPTAAGDRDALAHVSVIIPVRNEAASIERLLRSLSAQTYAPAEVVITDGGSTDGTREIIRAYQAQSPLAIVLVEVDAALPGRGRNLAIARAQHEWIACIDGGIVADADWLRELVACARREPSAQVVYGRYAPQTDTYFTESAAVAYVPAGRSRFIASCLLKRAAWAQAGGFREDLRSGEDLLFFQSLARAGVVETYCDTAHVTWELQPDLRRTFRRFVVYSRNSMRAGLGREWQYNVGRLYLLLCALLLIGLFAWRPLLLLPLLLLLLRAEKRIWHCYRGRLWRELLSPRRVLTVAWINSTIDCAALYGCWQWLVHDRIKTVTGDK